MRVLATPVSSSSPAAPSTAGDGDEKKTLPAERASRGRLSPAERDHFTGNGNSTASSGSAAATVDMKDIPAAAWTDFVLLNADNSLESFGEDDLNEMESVGSLDGKMNVIALVDGGSDTSNGWTPGTRLMWVTKDPTNSNQVVSREINVDPSSDLGKLLAAGKGELDTGDPNVLRAALAYVEANRPAPHLLVDLWDHGNDWRGISYDEDPTDDISMPELADALGKLPQKPDVLATDACLTACTEFADTAKAGGAKYLVGSEEDEPGAGWDYHDVLSRIDAAFGSKKTLGAAALSKVIMDSYAAGGSGNATMSVTTLSKLPALDTAVSAFADALVNGKAFDNADMRTAYRNAKRFDDADQMDLGDFVTKALAVTTDATVKSTGQAVLTALKAASKHEESKDAGSSYAACTGLSIYAPDWGGSESVYNQADNPWAKNH